MPAAIAIPAIASVIGGGVAAGAGIYGAKKQAKATNQALQLERDNEARRRQEYDQMIAEQRRQWEAEQERRAPYRQASEATLRSIAASRGRPMPTIVPSTGRPVTSSGGTLRSLAGGY